MDFRNFVALPEKAKEKLHQLIVNEKLEFEHVPQECQCSNCGIVPMIHYVFPCNHPYCSDCYDAWVAGGRRCRKCNAKPGSQKKQDVELEMRIYGLRAVCPKAIVGCKEIVQLSNVLSHLDECRFSESRLLPILYKEGKNINTIEERQNLANLSQLVRDNQQLLNSCVKENLNLRQELEMSKAIEKNLLKRIDEMEITRDNDTLKISSLEKRANDSQVLLTQLTQSVALMDQKVNENIDSLEEDFAEMKLQVDTNETKMENFEENVAILELTVADSDNVMTSCNYKIRTALSRVDDIDMTLDVFETKLAKMEREIFKRSNAHDRITNSEGASGTELSSFVKRSDTFYKRTTSWRAQSVPQDSTSKDENKN